MNLSAIVRVPEDPERTIAPWADPGATLPPTASWVFHRKGSPHHGGLVVALASARPETPRVWGRVEARTCLDAEPELGFAPWTVRSSAIDPMLYRRGLGTRMYLELLRQITAWGGHVIVGSDYCCGGGTSPQALEVWGRLARFFPTGTKGNCRWVKATPRSAVLAIRAWEARR